MPNSSTLKQYIGLTEAGPLIITPVTAESIAIASTTLVQTEAGVFRFPRITSDASATWVAENDEIPVSESAADEVLVIPKKVAGLSVVSNELANDTSPAASEVIGTGLGRDIAKKIDAAFFGAAPASTAVQPGGLEYLGEEVTQIIGDPGTGIDAYVDARAAAESHGVGIDVFVVHPNTASDLAKLKTGTGSKQPLFGVGATSGIERAVLGIPIVVSPFVLPGTAWGLPKSTIYTVLREDVTVDIDKSVFFTSDRTAIRAILRIGFGFTQPETIIKIKAA